MMTRVLVVLLLLLTAPAFAQESWQGTRAATIFNGTIAVGGSDSTLRVDVRNASSLALVVKINPAGNGGVGAPTPFAKLAIQCRGHLADLSDSNNVFPWNPTPGTGLTGATDSLIYGTHAALAGLAPGNTEIMVNVSQASTFPRGAFIPLATPGGVSIHPAFVSFRLRHLAGSGTARVQVWLVGYQP